MFWSMQQTFTEKDSMRKAWGPRQPLVTGVGGGWLYLWPVWRKPSSAYHPEARMRPFPGTNPERSSNLDLARSWSPEDMVGRRGRKLPDFAPGGATTQISSKRAICNSIMDSVCVDQHVKQVMMLTGMFHRKEF